MTHAVGCILFQKFWRKLDLSKEDVSNGWGDVILNIREAVTQENELFGNGRREAKVKQRNSEKIEEGL